MVFSNDDIGRGDSTSAAWFRETVDYLQGKGIPATFFWIPTGEEGPSKGLTEWIDAIDWAMGLGHDI